jgi:hypothetical protein
MAAGEPHVLHFLGVVVVPQAFVEVATVARRSVIDR